MATELCLGLLSCRTIYLVFYTSLSYPPIYLLCFKVGECEGDLSDSLPDVAEPAGS